MSKIMTSAAFVQKALDVANNYKTLYVMGCFGAPMNATNKTRYTANNAYNRKPERVKMIEAATADTFGFDCVCLIKALLWGWSGDETQTYGGSRYASNGVPDIGEAAMIDACYGVSSVGWAWMAPGEVVWIPGHIGIYVGDGLAVEASPAWDNKVQITAVSNIYPRKGYHARKWNKHGKLPWLDYEKGESELTEQQVREIVREEIKSVEKERQREGVDKWAVPFVQQAIDAGLMAENANGTIDRPKDFLTRQEAAGLAVNILNAKK